MPQSNSERCPHCGQRLPLEELPEGVRFSPIKQLIWQAIVAWPGMSAREIIEWCYGHDPNGGPDSRNIIAVHVAHMNRTLRAHGIKISGHPDGYHIQQIKED